LIRIIFIDAPEDILKKLNSLDKNLRKWLQFENNSEINQNRTANEIAFRKCADEFKFFFSILESSGNNEIILIPDTNAIIELNDPSQYRKLINNYAFVFLLLPTVLSELDKLSRNHNNQDFRNKVKKINNSN